MDNEAIKVHRLYERLKAKTEKERKVWDRCYGYTNNWVDGELGQWETDIRNELKAQGKPAISFNEMKKFVNRICGSQRLTKIDEKAYARDDQSDPQVATIITDLLKYVRHVNNAEQSFSRAFRDEVITGQGWAKVEWNDDLDPEGEVYVTSVSPKRVYIVGDGERYDLKDRRGILEVIPMEEEEIIARWPDSSGEIKNLRYSVREQEEIPYAGDYDYAAVDGTITPAEFFDNETGKFLVLRYQKYVYKNVTFVVDPMTGKLTELDVEGKELQQALALLEAEVGMPIQTITKKKRKVDISYSVATVVLEEGPSPYKHNEFDLVGFFAYHDDGRITGIAQDLLDPQDEKNKRHSQMIHILGISAKGSYFTKANAFADPTDATRRLGKTGQFIPVKGAGPIKELIQPVETNFSAIGPLVQLEMMSTNEMKEISGIHDAALGKVPNQVRSGIAIQELQQPSETIVAEFFDNYLQSRKIASDLMVSLMQQFYTQERRIRILGDYSENNLTPEMQQQKAQGTLSMEEGAKIVTINKQMLEGKLNDVTVGRFDIVLDHVSQNPTTRREQFYTMLNMRSMGIPISDEAIIEASDIRNKQKILTELQAQRELIMAKAALGIQEPGVPSMPNQPNEGVNTGGNQSPMG
jgi:hypothetical protein